MDGGEQRRNRVRAVLNLALEFAPFMGLCAVVILTVSAGTLLMSNHYRAGVVAALLAALCGASAQSCAEWLQRRDGE